MRKLLKANFRRLWKDKAFLISMILMVIYGGALPIIHYFDNIQNGIAGWTWDATLFSFVMIAPILQAVSSALFIGVEYSDGTMRNKLIAGHHRSYVYLANLFICAFAGILLSVAFLVPYTCVGIPVLGVGETKLTAIFLNMGLSVGLGVAFSAIFILIGNAVAEQGICGGRLHPCDILSAVYGDSHCFFLK